MARGGNVDSTRMDTSKFHAIKFPRSDGSEARRPQNLDPTPDAEGAVNWHRLVHLDESTTVSWRRKIGYEIGKLKGMLDPSNCIIEDWPAHYAFYDHNKGPLEAPRHDMYLYGGPSKFRSANEFIPHAIWLFTDETLSPENCKCKYCTKSPRQTQISEAHGLSRPGSSSTAKKPAAAGIRKSASSRKVSNPSQICNHKRVSDLRTGRWFREGELVWCALSPALTSTSNALSPKLQFWPGFIQERNLSIYLPPQVNGVSAKPRHTYRYTIKLLALSQTAVLPESSIVPYQAYQPSRNLLQYLNLCPKEDISTPDGMRNLHSRRVCLLTDKTLHPKSTMANAAVNIEDVAAAITLAIEIAAQLVVLWSQSDEWHFEGIRSQVDGNEISVSETRFQGLWWGSERIWLEDVVRLKIRRDLLVPSSISTVLPPGRGATDRGVFLRISSIFMATLPDNNPICRVSGMLYELVDKEGASILPVSHSGEIKQVSRSIPWLAADEASAAHSRLMSPNSSKKIQTSIVGSHTGLPPSPSIPNTIDLPSGPMFKGKTSTAIDEYQESLLEPFSITRPENRGVAPHMLHINPNYPAPDQGGDSGLSGPIPLVREGVGSNPLEYRFLMPRPPNGCEFQPIVKAGHEVWFDVSYIAGRYYSGLLESPSLSMSLYPPTAIELMEEPEETELRKKWLRTLEGFHPGYVNSIEARLWHPSRALMARYADRIARQICFSHWKDFQAGPLQEESEEKQEPLPSFSQQTVMTDYLD